MGQGESARNGFTGGSSSSSAAILLPVSTITNKNSSAFLHHIATMAAVGCIFFSVWKTRARWQYQ